MDILRPAAKNKTEGLANVPWVGTQLWFCTTGPALLALVSPEKELLVPTTPRAPSLPMSSLGAPSLLSAELLYKSKIEGTISHTLIQALTGPCTIQGLGGRALSRSTRGSGRLQPLGRRRTTAQALESLELSEHPSWLQPAQQFAFQRLHLSLPLRRPYLQGECENPLVMPASGTILPLRASWYLGLIPLWKHWVESPEKVRGLITASVDI